MDPWELSLIESELRERKPYYPQCADMTCGAEDCPHCHPENFTNGIYYEDQPRP